MHDADLGAIMASIVQALYPAMTAEAVWRRVSADMAFAMTLLVAPDKISKGR